MSLWVLETAWGWIVQRGLRVGAPIQLAGPFATQEAAQAWIEGWHERGAYEGVETAGETLEERA